jgi:prephenate dehydrogenase
MAAPRRVALVGTGLIGGSIGLALRRLAYEVRGFDHDAGAFEQALVGHGYHAARASLS